MRAAFVEYCGPPPGAHPGDGFVTAATPTGAPWNVGAGVVLRVPPARRQACLDALLVAVAAFDEAAEQAGGLESLEDAVVDGFCANAEALATVCEFARLDNSECARRAEARGAVLRKARAFNRRGSTIALQAAGLLPPTPGGGEGRGGRAGAAAAGRFDVEDEN